ncbi:ABC transporter substrate-binding protein [Actinomadura meridiana]|uniref:ABC transporter substrate-binding protein n=1 Tax=Actinomadura meridiana TaxID=559626 RepID=A0ABP8BU06_9ACTN
MKRSYARTISIAAAAAIGLSLAGAGCSSSDDSKGPIKVGAINGVTGLFQTPEVPKAVKAVFDEVNAAGGINGRKLELISKDDAMDPARSGQAARELIKSENVVALAGSSSAVDCAVNRATYSKEKVVSVPAVGVDPSCFTSPNIAPVNPGPFTLTTAMLYYASETLKRDKVCLAYTILPGSGGGIDKAIKDWSDLTGKSLTLKNVAVGQGDPTRYLVQLKNAGCQAVAYNATVGPWFQQAKVQKMQNIDFILAANSYTDANAKVIPADMNVYAGTEWQPYTDPSLPGNDRWSKIADKNGIQKTAFSQGAVMSADIFVQVLKTIKGDITRESVTKAFKTMQPINYPMVGTPYVFGPDKEHNPIKGSQFVKATNGGWKVLPGGFTVPTPKK